MNEHILAAGKPPTRPFPFGTVSPFTASWDRPEGRRAALNKWVAVIAREIAKPYETKTERDAATAFVRSHRLSIAHSLHRKLCRKDVVSALTAMFEKSKEGDHC